MQTLHYTKPNRLDVLHDQLLAAGIALEQVQGAGQDIWLTVPDTQPTAPVDAVVAAHDATARTPAEQDAAALRAAVQTALAGIPGTTWGTLTAAQKQTLIVALLFKVGALDKTLTVRPLAEWL